MRHLAASVFGLILLAMLPLVFALLNANGQLQTLAQQGQLSVVAAVNNTEQGQALEHAQFAMERSLRQAEVVGAAAVMETYLAQRDRFFAAARAFVLDDNSIALQTQLAEREAVVLEALRNDGAAPALAAWPAVQQASAALAGNAGSAVQRARAEIAAQPSQSGARLWWMGALTLPLALAAALALAWRVSRRQQAIVRVLGDAITRLGEGQWKEPLFPPIARRHVRATAIAALAPHLDWLRMQLHALHDARRRLLIGILQDLRIPLHALADTTNTLRAELQTAQLSAPLGDTAGRLERSVQLLGQRIDTLDQALQLSGELGQRRSVGSQALLDLHDVVERVLAAQQSTLAARKIQVQTQLMHVPCIGDSEHIHTLVDKLLSAALKQTGDGGVLLAQTRRHDKAAELCVTAAADKAALPLAATFADATRELVDTAAVQQLAPEAENSALTELGFANAQRLAQTQGGELHLIRHAATRAASVVLRLPTGLAHA